jgi:rfaE bifunctional protein kinase chain/domain
MVALFEIFKHLKSKKILVLGDFLCDLYTKGVATRVSPEAPVVILNANEPQRLAGGAGNVVLNLLALGADVRPIGLLGEDFEGYHLRKTFEEKSISTEGIFHSKTVSTIVKHRFIADSQQLMRVDYEKIYQIDKELEDSIITKIASMMPGTSVVALSDYQKGFLTDRILNETIALAKEYKIPVIVDPKGKDFKKYQGATIIKPNFKEACQAANLSSQADINDVAKILLKMNVADAFIITRSEKGMAYFNSNQASFFPVRVKEVVDVTGAGDTALAMICFCVANSVDIASTIELANIASSIAIEKIGCAHVALKDIASRILEFTTQSKYLPDGSLEALRTIIEKKPYQFYFIDEKEDVTLSFLENLKSTLSQEAGLKKIVYCDKKKNHSLFMQILASFDEVDFILVDKGFVKQLIETTPPSSIQRLSKGQVVDLKSLEDLFNS